MQHYIAQTLYFWAFQDIKTLVSVLKEIIWVIMKALKLQCFKAFFNASLLRKQEQSKIKKRAML
jgi:hypothetical protein